MKSSLIISTYNRPEALRLCLSSVFLQSRKPDEIIISDDGSTASTTVLVNEMRILTDIPIKHIWQEDKGFRLAKMRNKAVAASDNEYIIEIDGDVMLHKDFVADHMAFARQGCYLKGGRTNLGRKLTEKLCASGKHRTIHWFTSGIESKPENAVHLPRLAAYLAPRYRKFKESALGCNMSFFKRDYLAVNGYDEQYEGWGGEDIDFGRRLQRNGLKKRHLKFAGIVFHLWHEDKFMYNKNKNISLSYRPDNDQPVYCLSGIDRYEGSRPIHDLETGRLIFEQD